MLCDFTFVMFLCVYYWYEAFAFILVWVSTLSLEFFPSQTTKNNKKLNIIT